MDQGTERRLLAYRTTKKGVTMYNSKSDPALAAIPSTSDAVLLAGNVVAGDSPPAPYVSRATEPSHAGKFFKSGRWWELERHDGVYLEDFGGINALKTDGTLQSGVDNKSSLLDAIDYCVKKRRAVIRINSGVWPFLSGGIELPVGINLKGHGHSSSLSQGGTVVLANYDEPTAANAFLHWTGSGQPYNATGGGAHCLTILKGRDKTGGTLLRITGVNDSNRPGYMSFRDLRVGGTNGAANCAYCIIQDGSNLTTVNTNGIRDVLWDNIWIDGWTAEGAQFNNATHAKLQGFTASPSGTSVNCVRISGNNSGATSKTISLSAVGLEVYGNLILDNIHDCSISCRATQLVITGNVTNSIIIPVVGGGIVYSGTIGGNPTSRALLKSVNKTVILDGN